MQRLFIFLFLLLCSCQTIHQPGDLFFVGGYDAANKETIYLDNFFDNTPYSIYNPTKVLAGKDSFEYSFFEIVQNQPFSIFDYKVVKDKSFSFQLSIKDERYAININWETLRKKKIGTTSQMNLKILQELSYKEIKENFSILQESRNVLVVGSGNNQSPEYYLLYKK